MKRRTMLTASAALPMLAWPLRQPLAERLGEIGWLSYFHATDAAPYRAAFLDGMTELGLVRGRDFHLVERYAEERVEVVDGLLAELGSRPVKLIVTYGPTVKRAIDARLSRPTLFAFSGDAVDAGFTSSLARPDRNATGIAYFAADLNAKRVELLSDIMPTLRRIAVLSNPLHPGELKELAVARAAASGRGIELVHLTARDGAGIDRALADPSMESIGALAERLVRGSAAAELPIEQPTRFELVLNLKTAAALGLSLPAALLAGADEVIE